MMLPGMHPCRIWGIGPKFSGFPITPQDHFQNEHPTMPLTKPVDRPIGTHVGRSRSQ